MALFNHFDRGVDAGFRRVMEPVDARRQLCMSVGLVVVLALAAGSMAASVGASSSAPVAARAMHAPLLVTGVQKPRFLDVRQAGGGHAANGG